MAKPKPQRTRSASTDSLADEFKRVTKWLEQGRTQDVVHWTTEMLRQQPDNDELQQKAVSLFSLAERADLALPIAESLYRDQPSSPSNAIRLVTVYASLGMDTKALATWAELTNKYRDLPENAAEFPVIAWHKRNCFDVADRFLDSALELFPRSAKIWFHKGYGQYQLNQYPSAIESLSCAVDLDPKCATYWYNLAVALEAKRDVESTTKARNAYEKVIEIAPFHVLAQRNLAILLAKCGQESAAIEHLNHILPEDPKPGRTHFLLGFNHRVLGQNDAAISHFQKAVQNDPSDDQAREMLGRTLAEDNKIDQAILEYQKWLQRSPQNPVARHLLLALSGESKPDRASAEYVTAAFDQFADTFDSALERLGYQAPQLIENLVNDHVGEPSKSLDILDAGCGTGKCGALLSPHAKHLTGVDLSPKMLEFARKTGHYNTIQQCDLIDYLQSQHQTFDLIVACDTFNYFGDLTTLFQHCFQALRDNGSIVFTVEEGPLTGESFYLQTHGRFTHSPAYLMETLGELGVCGGTMRRSVLRKENDRDVYGLLMAIRKPDAPNEF